MSTLKPTARLFDALDLDSLPPKEQEELLLDMEELVFKGSILRMLEDMDEATKRDFDQLMKGSPSDEAIEGFLAERVPGAQAAVEQTLRDLEDDILAVTGESLD